MTMEDNARIIFKIFKSYGFSDIANCAIIGNLQHESNLKPTVTETGGFGGYGLAQWTPKSNLYTQGAALGYSNSECEKIETQAHIIAQATKVGQWTNAMSTRYDVGERVSPLTFTSFKKMTDLKTATVNFMGHYLRPTYKSADNKIYAQRYPHAQHWYEVLVKNGGDTGGGDGGGGDGGGGDTGGGDTGGGDTGGGDTTPPPTSNKDTINEIIKHLQNGKKDISFSIDTKEFKEYLNNEIKKIFNIVSYRNTDEFYSNTFFKITKTFKNMQKINPTSEYFKKLAEIILEAIKKIKISSNIDEIFTDLEGNIKDLEEDWSSGDTGGGDTGGGDTGGGDTGGGNDDFYFPVNYNISGINFWVPPHKAGSVQEGMEYGGPRSSGRLHAGYDIGAGGTTGIKVYSVKSGKVTKVETQGAAGFLIVIKNDNDEFHCLYQHLVTNSNVVKVGDKVKAGQHIATMGNSGGNYSIHLHMEISKTGQFHNMDTTSNPREYLQVTGNNKTKLKNPEG